MRAIIQRVSQARVTTIDSEKLGAIDSGLLVLLGFESEDTNDDIYWLAKKICSLRIFNDAKGIMNLSLQETKGSVLLVSQFTLYASTKKGRRPSYIRSASPEIAKPLYEKAIVAFEEILQKKVATGRFGAQMKVILCNDGPVTIFIDTKNKE